MSTYRECDCRDEDGRMLGKECPHRSVSKHGKWGMVLRLPTSTGRRQLRRTGFSTAKAARAHEAHVAALLAVAADIVDQQLIGDLIFASGRHLPDVEEVRRRYGRGQALVDRTTLASWLVSWLTDKARGDTRPGTLRSYQQHCHDYLTPKLGDVTLRRLRPQMISAMLATIRVERGLSAATVQRVRATLRSALSDAVRAGIIDSNPATYATVPTAPRPKVPTLDPAQVGVLLDHAAPHRLGSLFEVAVLTGLRRGELLGLRWSDVDLDTGVLRVEQAVVQDVANVDPCPSCEGVHRGLRFTEPKTRGSVGRVDLDDRATGALLAHRFTQEAERSDWGAAYVDHGLVFARENGQPYDPATVTRGFRLVAKASGLGGIWLHAFGRHGHASLLIASGVDIGIVSKRLRHSSIAVTSDSYAHLLSGVGRQAAEAASALIPARRVPDCDTSVTADPFEPEAAGRPLEEMAGQDSGPRGTRTHNPRIKSPLLCQLS